MAENAMTDGMEGEDPTFLPGDLRAARTPVPSARQIDQGQRHEYAAPVVVDEGPTGARGFMQEFLAGVKALDPRGITGGVSPRLLIFQLLFMTFSATDVTYVLLPQLKAEFGFSFTFLTTLQAAATVSLLLITPLLGYGIDRLRRTYMVGGGAVLAIGATLSAPLMASIGGFFLKETLRSFSRVLIQYPLQVMLADEYPVHSRARIYSLSFLFTYIPVIVLAPLAGVVANQVGWRGTMLGELGLAVPLLIGSLFLREPVRGYQDRLAAGASEDVAKEAQAPVAFTEGFRAYISIKTVRRQMLATPIVLVAGLAIGTFVQVYAITQFKADPVLIGIIRALSAVGGIIGLLIAGPLADRLLAFRPGRVMTLYGLTFMIQAAGYLLLALIPNLLIMNMFSIVSGAMTAAIIPAEITILVMVVPPRIRGIGLTAATPLLLVGYAFIPVATAVLDNFGARAGLLMFVPVLVLGGFLYMSASGTIEQDMRTARANAMADEAVRKAKESGRTKMLVIRDLDVTYDGAQVLFNLDLDVEEGELLALLGTNGAGKSTLLRAIAGIQPASNGAIYFDGFDITHAPADQNAQRGIVMMPGGRAVFPTLTVRENLETASWTYRDDAARFREQMERVLDIFPRLRERMNTRAANMSGGEQQQLSLAQCLMMRPRLLMIDELSLGLSPAVVLQLLDTLREIHKLGTTIIVVEQSINVALSIAERAIYMEKGEIKFDGSTAELISRPDVVQSVFMGRAVSASLGGAGRHRSVHDARETILTVSDIGVSYGGVRALDGVSLEVASGEVVGVVGANGAGKTTLFEVISGFQKPNSGSIEFSQQIVTAMSPESRAHLGISRSFQNVRLFPALTVRENIAVALETQLESTNPFLAAVYHPRARRVERRSLRRVNNLVESLNLGPFADKFVNELSTGTRRIVDIACVLATAPKLLLLDEPSSGLAQAETEQLGPVIGRINKELDCAILVIEHDLALVSSVADRLIAFHLGEVMKEGAPNEVLEDPDVVAALIGRPEGALARSGVIAFAG